MQPLLHIGYHKTATTWLQEHVFPNSKAGFYRITRPEVLQSTFARLNPFGFEPDVAYEQFAPGIREAQAQNLVPVLSAERLSGSPHSGGHDSKIIADRLVAVFPNARVLVMIREQTSMIVALYKQYVKMGGPGSLQQYVIAPPGDHRVPLFRFDFLEYHRLIGYYQGLFGVANVLVLPYELLQTRPQGFLERLGGFLNVPATESEFRRLHVSQSALTLSLKRHANRYIVRDALNPAPPFAVDGSNEALVRLCDRADRRIPAVLRGGHERRWRRLAEREVGTRYAASNALTAKLIGIDLRMFGYACDPSR